MPGELQASLRLTADGAGFVGEVRVARSELDRLTGGTDRSRRAIVRHSAAQEGQTRSVREFGRTSAGASGQLRRYVASAVSLGAAAVAVRHFTRNLDELTQVSNAVRLANVPLDRQVAIQQRIIATALDARAPLAEVTQLYRLLGLAADELGASQEEVLLVTQTAARSVAASGSGAAAASGALLQLSQSLGGNVVQAQEFNSLIDGMPVLLRAAAVHVDGTGGSLAGLRREVIDGNVTAREFFDAILAGAEDVERRFEQTFPTIAEGVTNFDTSLTLLTRTINDSLGADRAIGNLLQDASEAVRDLDPEAVERLGVAFAVLAGAVGLRGALALGEYAVNAARVAAQSIRAARESARLQLALGRMEGVSVRAARGLVALGAAGRIARRGLALLGGPVGVVLLAAYALYEFATASESAEDRLEALRDSVDPTNTSIEELTEKLRELSEAERAVVVAATSDSISNLLSDLEAAETRLVRLENARGRNRASAAAITRQQARVDGLRREIETARADLERLERAAERAAIAPPGEDAVVTVPRNEEFEEFQRAQLKALDETAGAIAEANAEYERQIDLIRESENVSEAAAREAILRAGVIREAAIEAAREDAREQAEEEARELQDQENRRTAVQVQARAHTADLIAEETARLREEELRLAQGYRSEEEADEAEHQQRLSDIRRQALYDEFEERAAIAQGFRNAEEAEETALRQRLIQLQHGLLPEVANILAEVELLHVQSGRNQVITALGIVSDAFTQLGALSAGAFKVAQAAAIAQTIISTITGVQEAYRSGLQIPAPAPIPQIAAVTLAAAAAAAGYARVQQIRAQRRPQAFRRGGIVEEATFFASRGVPEGVAGEAGPEAIVPLRRDGSGNLGVGQSPVTVRVNVINAAGAAVSVAERQGPDGGVDFDIRIDRAVSGALDGGPRTRASLGRLGVRAPLEGR